MGEVRVKVKLTNAGDEFNARRNFIPSDKIRYYEGEAVVDTGAVRSCIPNDILEILGIQVLKKQNVVYANCLGESIGLTESIKFDIMDRETIDEALVLGDVILIGQTVLEKMDLLVDRNNRAVIPNPKHPDGPVTMVRFMK